MRFGRPEGLCLSHRFQVAQSSVSVGVVPWELGTACAYGQGEGGGGVLWGAVWPLPRRPDPEPGGRRPGQAKPWGPRLGPWRGGGSGWGWQLGRAMGVSPLPKPHPRGALKKDLACHREAVTCSPCSFPPTLPWVWEGRLLIQRKAGMLSSCPPGLQPLPVSLPSPMSPRHLVAESGTAPRGFASS